MNRFATVVFISFIIPSILFGGKKQMLEAALAVPGIVYAEFPQDISLWIAMDEPSGHNYEQYGYLLCEGGQDNFGVPKGYTITFWNRYTKKAISKFRCY